MSSKIIVVSTRAPTLPLSGGMAPAVKRACEEFESVIWYALDNRDQLKADFDASAFPENAQARHPVIEHHDIPDMVVKKLMVSGQRWDGHYNRASNSEIWPLCHDRDDMAARLPALDFYATMRVNDVMAKKIAEDLNGDTQTPIWIHDYHHFPLPTFLRANGVKNPIVFFNHIPLPDPEKLKGYSVKTQGNFLGIMEGLLCCDAVNFQTAETANRFMTLVGVDSPKNLAAYDQVEISVPINHHVETLKVGHYPISIDTQSVAENSVGELKSPAAKDLAARMVAPNIFINFERCDYSKGIKPRLLAFERLLNENPELAGQAQIVIGAEPTRKDIKEYTDYAKDVADIVDRINSKTEWACGTELPVLLLPEHIPNSDVIKLMRNGEGQRKIGTVTPYRDGMNLLSKEFVAAQDSQNPGVLILSSGAGAAAELDMDGQGAIVYDPDKTDGNTAQFHPDTNIAPISDAMLKAVNMGTEEAKSRHQKMMDHLKVYDISLWAEEHKKVMNGLSCPQHGLQAANANDALPVQQRHRAPA